jgi:hypothetical protein
MGGLYDVFAEITLSKEAKLAKLSRFNGKPEESAELVGKNICLHCHSDSVNSDNRKNYVMSFAGVTMRQLDSVKNPEYRKTFGLTNILQETPPYGMNSNHSLHVSDNDVPCAGCHVKVAHSGNYYGDINMQTCFDCHDEKRVEGKSPADNDNCFKCHGAQVALQAGEAAATFGVRSSVWEMASNDCLDCHEDAFSKPSRESCENCHDEGYAEIKDMVQESFDEQIGPADDFWSSQVRNRRNLPTAKQDIFNSYEALLGVLKKDGSRGIHNPAYTDAIFEQLKALAEKYESMPDN